MGDFNDCLEMNMCGITFRNPSIYIHLDKMEV